MTTEGFNRLCDMVKGDRLRAPSRVYGSILNSTESDKGRVINSAPFRRLQQKAQVFPLDPNASVRTRLTHSIEVSQVGRYIAQEVIERHKDLSDYIKLTSFVNIVETACLLHDIGNPPFGHLGEAAIRQWFNDKKKEEEKKEKKDRKDHKHLDDIINYDGNPQGFRLITFLNGIDNHGMNLTCSLLLATIKYPWKISDKPTDANKIGLFSSDYGCYEEACSRLNWIPGKKFPFVYLMEAADDISYSMSDLEDGLEKEIISIEELKKEFGESRFKFNGKISEFIYFKTDVIRKAVEEAANNFSDNLDSIIAGERVNILNETSEAGELLKNVKKYARKKIYSHKDAERVELAGRSVIKGLLEHFNALIELDENDFLALMNNKGSTIKNKHLDFHIRLLRLLPTSYRDKYRIGTRGSEDNRRAHLIVDYLSSMTDDFALEIYQVLEGIRIR